MKKINKIFLWAFVIISLLPIFEYFLYQWRNENRISISTNSTIGEINVTSNYVTINLPVEINSFSDYIINENHYGYIINNNTCQQEGLPKLLIITTYRILRLFYNNQALTKGNFAIQIVTISFILSRTLFVAVLLLFTYITVLPVVYVSDLLHRRLIK